MQQTMTIKLYSPLTGDFYKNDTDEYGWNNGVSDYPTLFSGIDMAYYEDSIRAAIDERNSGDGGNLMLYFDGKRSPEVRSKVVSAVPSVEIRGGELVGCTTVMLKEPLTDTEMDILQNYLSGQFSDGWGEGFEQHEIHTGDGVLYVHFAEKGFHFEVEQVSSHTPTELAVSDMDMNSRAPEKPKMKLIGEDGNIFAILSRASRLLRQSGQADKATEMYGRVTSSHNYYQALNIISEYVETELSDNGQQKKKRSGMER